MEQEGDPGFLEGFSHHVRFKITPLKKAVRERLSSVYSTHVVLGASYTWSNVKQLNLDTGPQMLPFSTCIYI